jgi:hypothetical protein
MEPPGGIQFRGCNEPFRVAVRERGRGIEGGTLAWEIGANA